MRARIVLLSVVVAASWTATLAPAARAGGCGSDPTHGTGTVVSLEDMCVRPTITTVDPGTTITFVNRDPFDHNINGQGWGHWDDLRPSERYEATFSEAGIYPYACTLHPGMTGAIVVGDGTGPGNGEAVAVAAPTSSEPPAQAAAPVAIQPATATTTKWVPAAIVALLIGGVLGFGIASLRRRRTERITAQPAQL
jgi:plastocyanin